MADKPDHVPAIVPSDVSREFWAATANGKFLLQQDKVPATLFPPRPRQVTGGKPPSFSGASGTGVLVAVTLCRVPAHGFKDKTPYLVGIVKLDEGPRVFATLVNAQPGAIRPGQKMRMVWLDGDGKARLYAFEPAP